MPKLVTNIVDGKHGEENVCSILKEKYYNNNNNNNNN